MLNWLRGREARRTSRGWNVAKTLTQTLIFWCVFLVLLPAGVWWLEDWLGLTWWRFDSPATRWLGVVLFALGGCLGLTSGTVMAVCGHGTPLPADCPTQLVVAGPYRFIRNPMAVAGLGQGVAVGLFLGSPAVIASALLGGPMWNWLVRPWEEADLEARFGEGYRRYRAVVRCWLPCFPGYRAEPVAVEPPRESR